mmetsp:Transcript_73066/g.161638  ORF Transcript_73066/g.161638 Transcript_73066/m.161638 type:complete len:296 (-) Transcript_73066:884-1771(-)
MDVDIEYHLAVVQQVSEHALRKEDRRVQLPTGVAPQAVQVLPGQGATVVSNDDAVRVQHGYDLEDEVVAQDPGVQGGAGEVVQHALHNPGGIGLPRMHPGSDHHRPPCAQRSRIAAEGRDGDEIASVAGQGLAELASPEPARHIRILLQVPQVVLQVTVAVRIAMREVDHITVVLERDRPSESVVAHAAFVLAPDAILVVCDVGAVPHPTSNTLGRLYGRVHERAHAFVVHRGGLHHVDDVEAVRNVLPGVSDSEEVPLRMRLGVIVRVENKVILVVVDLDGPPEVATLEPALED